MTIGVVVADDQAIVRAGFRMLIDSEPDLAVLGEAANGAEAVAVARRTSPGALEQLTVREREVLALIATGLSNTEIAERLIMSVPTAKTHVSRILAKLGARDRAQLVVLAFQSGLVRPG